MSLPTGQGSPVGGPVAPALDLAGGWLEEVLQAEGRIRREEAEWAAEVAAVSRGFTRWPAAVPG